MSEFADMAAFVAVVEMASFTDAAYRLSTSKSVVSRRVSDLEKALGAPLLDRSARSVRPTEVGAVYYAKCVRILESVAAADEFVAGANGMMSGRLRILMPESLAVALIVPLLDRFSAGHPQISLDAHVTGNFAALVDSHFDAAIQSGELPDSALVARHLIDMPYVLCASPDYLARRGAPASFDALAEHDGLIHFRPENQGLWQLRREGEWRPCRIRERMRSNSASGLLTAARDGLGVTLLPAALAIDDLESGNLRSLLPEIVPPPLPVFLVYPKSRRASQKVQALQAFLADALAASPSWETRIGALPQVR